MLVPTQKPKPLLVRPHVADSIRIFPLPGFLGLRSQRGDEFFVKGEEELKALAIIFKGLGAIASFNSPVQVRMSLRQIRRHRQRVVKVG